MFMHSLSDREPFHSGYHESKQIKAGENVQKNYIYRTRAIITRGLYTFYPIFEGQKRLFKELFL